jgi:hypothetical protein
MNDNQTMVQSVCSGVTVMDAVAATVLVEVAGAVVVDV